MKVLWKAHKISHQYRAGRLVMIVQNKMLIQSKTYGHLILVHHIKLVQRVVWTMNSRVKYMLTVRYI